MSDVEVISSSDYTYKIKYNPAIENQVKLISFSPHKTRVFMINTYITKDEASLGDRLYVCVCLKNNLVVYELENAEVTVTASVSGNTESKSFGKKNVCAWLFCRKGMFFRQPIDLEFKFRSSNDEIEPPTIKSFAADLRTFLKEGKKITLVGSDGEVQVSKFLLKLRSPALKAMFAHDTKESRESTIDLKDFDCKTLNAYVKFLTTDKLDNDSQTSALGLYIFADKYHIEGLKETAKNYILTNMKQFDLNEVYEVFTKIDPDLIKTTFGKFFCK